jgi:hypothetical protein
MKSWKTTTSGIATIVLVICQVVIDVTEGKPVDVPTLIAAFTAGLGLLFARDNNKTSEDVGVK